jgi:hypothetical protein
VQEDGEGQRKKGALDPYEAGSFDKAAQKGILNLNLNLNRNLDLNLNLKPEFTC